MGVLNSLSCFLSFLTVISAKEFVPLLLWGNEAPYNSYSSVPALKRFSTDEFSDFLSQKVKVGNPVVLAFIEENLSVEDFSWRDANDNTAYPVLGNLTKSVADLLFLPSVHNPSRAVKNLKEHGHRLIEYREDVFSALPTNQAVVVLVKLTEPQVLEDRPDMLRQHDEQMRNVYNEALNARSNVLAIYTGRHSSWIDSQIDYNRVRREAKEEGTGEEVTKTVIQADIAVLPNKKILLSADGNVEFFDGVKTTNLTKLTGTSQVGTGWLTLDVNSNEGTDFDLNFTINIDPADASGLGGAWTLSSVYLNESKSIAYTTTHDISAPAGYSYHNGQGVVFSAKVDDKTHTLSFKNFQLQPITEGKFSTAVDSIPFFSTAIWSGIFVIFILALVVAWGIVMIMDINTMDRFDDPKGKTITISANE